MFYVPRSFDFGDFHIIHIQGAICDPNTGVRRGANFETDIDSDTGTDIDSDTGAAIGTSIGTSIGTICGTIKVTASDSICAAGSCLILS